MSDTATYPAQLNLDEGVTAEQFQAALQAIWTYTRDTLRPQHGWCGEWVRTIRRISRRFPRDRSFDVVLPEVTQAVPGEWLTDVGRVALAERDRTRYAQELREVRGRVLSLVDNGTVSLQEANEGLKLAGLAPYGDSEGLDYYTYLTVNVRSRSSSREEIRSVLSDRSLAALNAAYADAGLEVTSIAYDSVYRSTASTAPIPSDQLVTLL